MADSFRLYSLIQDFWKSAERDKTTARQCADQALAMVLQNPKEHSSDLWTLIHCFLFLDDPAKAATCAQTYLLGNNAYGQGLSHFLGRWQNDKTGAGDVNLQQLAGNLTRAGDTAAAIALYTKMGRAAKAQRLQGRRLYAVDEIDFPRGALRQIAVGRLLEEILLVVEGYVGARQVDKAKDAMEEYVRYHGDSSAFQQCARRHGPKMQRLASELGVHIRDEFQRCTSERAAWAARHMSALGSVPRLFEEPDPDGLEFSPHYLRVPSIIASLEEMGRYTEILDLFEIRDTGRSKSVCYKRLDDLAKARALYALGRLKEAADVARGVRLERGEGDDTFERRHWCGACYKTYPGFQYEWHLGLASLYDDAGDKSSTARVLAHGEREFRRVGLWQDALGMYFDAGRFKDVERVAREEDELECAVIAYEAGQLHEDAARIYAEMAGSARSVGVSRGDSRAADEGWKSRSENAGIGRSARATAFGGTECARCGAHVEPDWVVCPECDGDLQEPRCPNKDCGRPVKVHWKRCPVCRTEIR